MNELRQQHKKQVLFRETPVKPVFFNLLDLRRRFYALPLKVSCKVLTYHCTNINCKLWETHRTLSRVENGQ